MKPWIKKKKEEIEKGIGKKTHQFKKQNKSELMEKMRKRRTKILQKNWR